ncbi:MAG: MarR family transcriptional regulator [Limnochordales bacterium]|nr:MarR family transcriptional regulator [Limnochordales bacterium]
MAESPVNWEERAALLDDLILSIGQRLLRYFASKSEDLTMKDIFVLETLSRLGQATMTELASALAVPLTTMTSIVGRLVEKGYLERRRTEEDRRVVLVSLSSAGQTLFARQRQEYVQAVREILTVLPEEDQAKLLGLISEVLEVLSHRCR